MVSIYQTVAAQSFHACFACLLRMAFLGLHADGGVLFPIYNKLMKSKQPQPYEKVNHYLYKISFSLRL